MARAIRVDVNPSDPDDYYILLDSGLIRNNDGVNAEITEPYTQQGNPFNPRVVGFDVTSWGSPRKGYVCTDRGLVYSFGGSPGTGQVGGLFVGADARDMAANPATNGEAVVLSRLGTVRGLGGLTNIIQSALFDADLARRIVVTSWSPVKGYILDAYGGVHAFGGATAMTTAGDGYYDPGHDFARALALNPTTPATNGGYVMNGGGYIYRLGASTKPLVRRGGVWYGDIGTDLFIYQWTSPVEGYQLDQEGGLHVVRTSDPPTWEWTTPTHLGTIKDDAFPFIGGDYDDPDGDPQRYIRIWVYTKAQTLVPGFVAGSSAFPHTWNSGRIESSTIHNVQVGAGRIATAPVEEGTRTRAPLQPNIYRAYAEVWDSTGQSSGVVGPVEWTQVYDPGASPVLTAEPDTDNGAMAITVRVPDNVLTKQQATPEANTATGWVNDNLSTVARSVTYNVRGTASVLMTATGTGDMRMRTSTKFGAAPNINLTGMAKLRQGNNPHEVRLVLREYDASDNLLRSTPGNSIEQTGYASPPTEEGPTPDIIISDSTPMSGDTVILNGVNSSDPNGLALTYQWLQDQGPPITFVDIYPGTSVAVRVTMPTVTFDTDVTFALRVTNSLGVSTTSEVQAVTVKPRTAPPTKPIAFIDVAPGSTPIVPGTVVQLNGSRSTDPDARGALTYTWSQLAGTNANLSNLPGGVYPNIVKQFTAPTPTGGFSYPHTLAYQLIITAADGTDSDPAVAYATVEDPAPTNPTPSGGGAKNLKRAIMFTSNIDAAERWKRWGRKPFWEFRYSIVQSWDTWTTSIGRCSEANDGRGINFDLAPFPHDKGPASDLITASNGGFNAHYDEAARIISGLPASATRNLVINLAREHTGFWYSWAPLYGDGTSNGKQTNSSTITTRVNAYKTMWRNIRNRIVNACDRAGKPRPKFSQTFTADTDTLTRDLTLRTYAGDAYVDFVGHNIYSWWPNSTPSGVDSHVAWWDAFVRGRTRKNDAGALVTGQGKPLVINEMALRLKHTGDVSRRCTSWPNAGDAIWFYQKVFDWAQRLISTGPGVHHISLFEVSPANNNQLHSAICHVSDGTGAGNDFGRPVRVTDVARLSPGQCRCTDGQGGLGTVRAWAGIGSTARANYQNSAPRAMQYVLDRLGGPLGPGE